MKTSTDTKARKKTIIPEKGADEFIKGLPFAREGSYTVHDSATKLCVEVYATVKTFRLRNTVHPSRPWIRIGNTDDMTCEEAREAVAVLRKKLRDGKAPVFDKEQFKKIPTLKEAFDLASAELLQTGINKQKTIKIKASALNVCGKNFYGRSLSDFTSRELIAKATWFRLKYSRTFFDSFYNAVFDAFSYAIRHNYPIERNLAVDIRSVKTRKKDVRLDRRDVEIEQVVMFNQLWLQHPRCPLRLEHIVALHLSLYTGLRIGCTMLIEKSDFDWEAGWLIIPVEKQKHRLEFIENYSTLYIAITEVLIDIIRPQLDAHPESRWLFPSFQKVRKGQRFDQPAMTPTSQLNLAFRVRDGRTDRIDPYQVSRHQRVLIPKAVRKFVPHEYGRHTFATIANAAKIPPRIISTMMGHAFSADQKKDKDAAAPTTAKTYIHSQDAQELREWWFVWARHYCEMLGLPVPQSVLDEVARSRSYIQKAVIDELADACGGDLSLALEQLRALKGKGQFTALRLVKAKGGRKAS